jgi:translation initiation factor IF-1
MKNKKDFLEVKGKIISLLGNNTFLVELLENKQQIQATISRHRFRLSARQAQKSQRLVIGKMVVVEIPLDDFSKGRIVALD